MDIALGMSKERCIRRGRRRFSFAPGLRDDREFADRFTATQIWKPYLPNAEWVTVSGNHLSMIVARNARKFATPLDQHLRPAPASMPEVSQGSSPDVPSDSESLAA